MKNAKVLYGRFLPTLALLCVLIVPFQNCGKGFQAKIQNQTSNSSTNGGTTGGTTGTTGGTVLGTVALSQPASQVATLGSQTVVPVTLTANANYNGTVKVTISEPELSMIDIGSAITFTLDKTSVMLQANGTATVNVTINVSTMSPSFPLSMFHIVATDSVNSAITQSVAVPLQVKAEYDVQLLGQVTAGVPAPEKWSLANGSTVSFISHSEGLVVNFINYDKAVHSIHSSSGPIPSETGAGLAASPDGKQAGGTYMVTITSGSAPSMSQVWCALHETMADARTFNFDVAPANPNATFFYISNNIFKTTCVTCHGPGNMQAGVDLSTYAGVLNVVSKYSASTSILYNQVVGPNPKMPLGGTPLTAAQVKDIQDWINLGAAND